MFYDINLEEAGWNSIESFWEGEDAALDRAWYYRSLLRYRTVSKDRKLNFHEKELYQRAIEKFYSYDPNKMRVAKMPNKLNSIDIANREKRNLHLYYQFEWDTTGRDFQYFLRILGNPGGSVRDLETTGSANGIAGQVYFFKDGKVVKFVGDKAELIKMKKFEGKKFPGLPYVYKVHYFDRAEIGVIVMENAGKTLKDTGRDTRNTWAMKIGHAIIDFTAHNLISYSCEIIEETIEKIAKKHELGGKRLELFNNICDVIVAMLAIGYDVGVDLHANNACYSPSRDEVVIIDFGLFKEL